jgi:hypothetical protein
VRAAGDATTFAGVACGEDDVLVDLPADEVTAVGVAGSGADRPGAWSAQVLGEVPAEPEVTGAG